MSYYYIVVVNDSPNWVGVSGFDNETAAIDERDDLISKGYTAVALRLDLGDYSTIILS